MLSQPATVLQAVVPMERWANMSSGPPRGLDLTRDRSSAGEAQLNYYEYRLCSQLELKRNNDTSKADK